MNVVIAGGHGQIALRLLRLLSEAGHRGRGLIRNPDQAADLEAAGGEPILLDLEREEIGDAVAGADAVVFAAGAGPGSGPERKRTVDLGGAVKLIDGARENGILRYVMISAMGARDPSTGSEAMRPYLEAKSEADAELERSDLDWTIVRPGRLTNDPGTGHVEAARTLERRGEIPRDDVAATLLAVLGADNTIGVAFDLLSGETPIRDAIRNI